MHCGRPKQVIFCAMVSWQSWDKEMCHKQKESQAVLCVIVHNLGYQSSKCVDIRLQDR